MILGRFGPDIAFISRALGATFDLCAIDPARMGIAVFSDGASYALSVGIANGDLFPRAMRSCPSRPANLAGSRF